MDTSLGSGDTKRSQSISPRLGSGDTQRSQSVSPRYSMEGKDTTKVDDHFNNEAEETNAQGEKPSNLISSQTIEDHEIKLKNRIDQCRSVIESLKLELSEEKAKLEKDTKDQSHHPPYNWRLELDDEKAKIERELKGVDLSYTTQVTDDFMNSFPGLSSMGYNMSSSNDILGDFPMCTNMYSACVDSRLNCDENLMKYERQLEKYQTTLNRAQAEKKSAIRKRMLTKAYKLKLMELENQCNIELLRVKQSLQCLEPLQMIVNQWKTGSDSGSYDLENFELMPCYPEISAPSGIDIEAVKDEPSGSNGAEVLDITE